MAPTSMPAVLVTLLLGVSTSVSATGVDTTRTGLRADRRVQATETVLCLTYTCPNGYNQIEDNQTTECTDGVCTLEQCCVLQTTGGNDDVDNGDDGDGLCVPDTTTTVEGEFCNAIGCPCGFIPIPDAAVTPCTGGTCAVSECCDTFCWSFPCPDSFTPDPDTNGDLCDGQVCTQEQCCEALCSGFACTGGLIPIVNASAIECTNQECTNDQCCTVTAPNDNSATNTTLLCLTLACPNGFIPIEESQTTVCTDNICTSDQCCEEQVTVPANNTTDAPVVVTGDGNGMCNSIGCPDNFIPIEDAWSTPCTNDVCTVSQCCETFCFSFACPDSFTPNNATSNDLCDNQVCTQEQCCEALCSGFACPDGFIPIENASEIECTSQECTTTQCCEANP